MGERISSYPARIAQRPRAKAPEPNPLSADAARLLDAAFALLCLAALLSSAGARRKSSHTLIRIQGESAHRLGRTVMSATDMT